MGGEKLRVPNYEHLPVSLRQEIVKWGYGKDPDSVRRFFKEIYSISEDRPDAQLILKGTILNQKDELAGGLEALA